MFVFAAPLPRCQFGNPLRIHSERPHAGRVRRHKWQTVRVQERVDGKGPEASRLPAGRLQVGFG